MEEAGVVSLRSMVSVSLADSGGKTLLLRVGLEYCVETTAVDPASHFPTMTEMSQSYKNIFHHSWKPIIFIQAAVYMWMSVNAVWLNIANLNLDDAKSSNMLHSCSLFRY